MGYTIMIPYFKGFPICVTPLSLPFSGEKLNQHKYLLLKYEYKFPLHLPFSLVVLSHFIDSSTLELFEFFGDLASDDDRMLSTEILCEFVECPLDAMD